MLVRIVIAPTAISPPNLESEEVKQIESTLSVDNITKVETPSARQGSTTFLSILRFSFFSLITLLSLTRKRSIQTALTAWLITVARAAPRTPILKAKMKIGSSAMFITAPITVVSMATFALPCAVINTFIPITMRTKTVPII